MEATKAMLDGNAWGWPQCVIALGSGSLTSSLPSFKQRVSKELFHCFQEKNYPLQWQAGWAKVRLGPPASLSFSGTSWVASFIADGGPSIYVTTPDNLIQDGLHLPDGWAPGQTGSGLPTYGWFTHLNDWGASSDLDDPILGTLDVESSNQFLTRGTAALTMFYTPENGEAETSMIDVWVEFAALGGDDVLPPDYHACRGLGR